VTPKISICVPNLNTRSYLSHRFQTIFEQSCGDWELLVYDSHSDDGAWEFIQELAAVEPRMRAWQGPREGTPGSWTPCIREARGEYVYIATSDDTMPPDFLQTMSDALDAHPECDLAHAPLRAIDEWGHELADWWSDDSVFCRSSGALARRRHLRRAPFDGLLHLAGISVYISITQLLIRRTLFDRIGLFESTWGSIGDFHWSMRAGLAANTVHVPETWGGWRIHRTQATAAAHIGSAGHAEKIERMIGDAVHACANWLPAAIVERLQREWAPEAARWRAFKRGVADRERAVRRRAYVMRHLLSGSPAAWEHAADKLLSGRSCEESFSRRARRWLHSTHVGPVLVACPCSATLSRS